MTGIFCIETQWGTGRRVSVDKAISFVADFKGVRKPLHYTARTPEEFDGHLKKWSSRRDWEYPILYLAFHGFRKGLEVRSSGSPSLWDYVRLEQIADFAAGKWGNCLVHYASCSTMDVPASELRAFLEGTGVEAVSGYTVDVDWLASMAFDVMYLGTLLDVIGDKYVRGNGMRTCRDLMSNSEHTKGLGEALGFRMAVKGD